MRQRSGIDTITYHTCLKDRLGYCMTEHSTIWSLYTDTPYRHTTQRPLYIYVPSPKATDRTKMSPNGHFANTPSQFGPQDSESVQKFHSDLSRAILVSIITNINQLHLSALVSSLAEQNKQTFTLTEKSCLYFLCPKFTSLVSFFVDLKFLDQILLEILKLAPV